MSKNIKRNIVIVGSCNNDYPKWLGKLENSTITTVNSVDDYTKVVKSKQPISLVVFTGGADVNPDYYSQSMGKHTNINKLRDDFEVSLWERIPKSIPKIGICRGSQFLTVMSGGSLIQHVEGHCGDHSITVKEDFNLMMTSTHHQMLYPFDLNKDKYDLIAWSTHFKSDTYLNGRNEEMEIANDFLEPEIVYYKNTNSLAIQGHPEFSSCDEDASDYCLNLVKNLLNNNKL